MINAVTHALNNVYSNIPPEILDMAFDLKGGRLSVDEAIVQRVIEGNVLPDISALAGQFKEIVLDPNWAVHSSIDRKGNASMVSVPYAVYTIPPEFRENRSIVSVIDVSVPYGASTSFSMGIGATMSVGYSGVGAGTFAQQAMNGMTGEGNMLLPTPIPLSGNQIKLTPMEFGMMSTLSLVLRCRLEYDRDLTNLTPDAVLQFSELVLTATKQFIYNQLIVKIDQGAIMSGQEIGKVREIIESYMDAGDRYKVIREEFHGSAEALDINTLADRLALGIFL